MFKLGRLAALGMVATALVPTAAATNLAPEAPTDSTAPQLYGSAVAPRVKWTCPRCRQRNDTAIAVPIAKVEPVVCRKCRRMARLHFAPKEAA